MSQVTGAFAGCASLFRHGALGSGSDFDAILAANASNNRSARFLHTVDGQNPAPL